MKKHKSVVAILLAVMMIFTMMPMMAFAAAATGWAPNYSTVTDGKDTYKTQRVFGENGLITVTGTNEFAEVVVGKSDAVAPEGTKYYYDATGAYLAYAKDTKLDGSNWTQEAFGWNATTEKAAGLESMVGLNLVSQSYVKDYNAQKPATAFATGFGDGYVVEYKYAGYDPTKTTEDQKVTVTATISVAEGAKIDGDSPATAEFTGVREYTATVTVKGVAVTPSTCKFYFDTVGGTEVGKLMYDGAAHTVVADEVPGYTVSYTVYNQATGKYDPATSVSITDVQEKAMDVKAVFTKGNETPITKSLAVNLIPANGAEITFDQDASMTDEGFNYSVPGEEYDAASYIVVEAVEAPTSGKIYIVDEDGNEHAVTIDDKTRAANKVRNAATDKAVKANQALLKDFFNDYYEITAKATKANPSIINLKIAEKDLTQAEKKELEKKYAALVRNFGENIFVADGANADVYLNGGVFDYEVEFTKAPVGAKVIHIKKAKSLKKAKSFAVKAVANNGYTVYYKLINANSKIKINKKTGKVTLAKGLKKGTYKFQVKAYVPGVTAKTGTGYWETQNITVKVKK